MTTNEPTGPVFERATERIKQRLARPDVAAAVEACGWSSWGGYDHPPDWCDEDAVPGTDPPRCDLHMDDGELHEEDRDYFDED